MKKIVYRISAFMMAALFCIALIPFAFASSDMQYNQKATFFQWAGSLVQDVIGFGFGAACPNSEDGYHHSSSSLGHVTGFFGGETPYYDCICSYCGAKFTAYESDLKQSYDEQVESLPVTGYNSAGGLIWDTWYSFTGTGSLGFPCWSSYSYTFSLTWEEFNSFPATVGMGDDYGYYLTPYSTFYSLDSNNSAILASTVKSSGAFYPGFKTTVTVPVSGSYRMISSFKYSYRCVGTNGNIYTDSGNYSAGRFAHYGVGDSIEVSSSFDAMVRENGNYVMYSYGSGMLKLPLYEIIPDSAMSGDTYNINTRPTSITGGNYGIIGDNGQITQVTDNSTIVNETNNTYFNPATGQTSTITNWSYDYSDRSYNVTLESGDTVNVIYGDENIIIKEGDITYNIYYIVDGSGNGGETHTHEWYQTGARQGNCLTPAQRTYTCYTCGEQYTETDPVLGHSWHIIQTVSTKYDENGNLVQEGYTIYECERCEEQYKSTNDTGPPSSGGSSSGGGSNSGNSDNIFSGIFGIFWDFCSFMFDFFSDFVLGGVKGFIANLLDAGSDFFSILNTFSWDY